VSGERETGQRKGRINKESEKEKTEEKK